MQTSWRSQVERRLRADNAYTEASLTPGPPAGPWGSLVYPWWFGTTRLRFKSGRTHGPFSRRNPIPAFSPGSPSNQT